MNLPNTRAIELIQIQLDEIPALMSMDHSSHEAKEWRRKTEIVLERIFGENSREIKSFWGAYYRIAIPETDQESQEFYLRDLRSAKDALELIIEDEKWLYDQSQSATMQPSRSEPMDTKRVFVVHGHDEAAKQTVARYLERFELEPVILDNQPSQGNTVIGKFENYAETVGFAVIVGTPDDVGGLAGELDNLQPRMRQNVVFELGYFTHALGRKGVRVLLKGDIERPSDYDGVIYIPMDDGGGWKLTLGRELIDAGFDVDLNRL